MTREEAIERLEFHKKVWLMVDGIDLCEVLDIAIAALRYDGPKYVLLSTPPADAQTIDTGVPFTNADHIRSMTDDELAKWLDEDLSCCCYCSEDARLENEPLLHGEKCDEQCKKHLLDWLKQPYGGDT